MQIGEIRLASSISNAATGNPDLLELIESNVNRVLQHAAIVTPTARSAVRRAVTSARRCPRRAKWALFADYALSITVGCL